MKITVSHWVPSFSIAIILYLPLSQAVGIAQEEPVCFQVLPSGQVVDLRTLCRSDAVKNSDEAMNSQELYQRGFDRGGRRLYREAISDFTQAIRENPDYVEAFIARAYAHAASEKLQEAVKDFEQAAQIYRNRGDIEKAEIVQRSADDTRSELRERSGY